MPDRLTDEQFQEIETRCVARTLYAAMTPQFLRSEVKPLLAEIKALKQERDEARQTLATIRDDINICFVACERCGSEIDLKNLDIMSDIAKVLPDA